MISQKDPLPKYVYEILACPADKSELKYTPDKKGLRCVRCGRVYPIEEGIPNFLIG